MKETRVRSQDRVVEWILRAGTREVIDSSQTFAGGSDSEEAITERQDRTPYQSNTSSARVGEVFTCSTREDKNGLASLLSSKSAPITAVSPTPAPNSYEPLDAEEADDAPASGFYLSTSSTDHLPLESLDEWLSELFSNTLQDQLKGTHFIGGAEIENSTLDFCPICYGPLGAPRDQHLLQCQYAHDEQVRMEKFIAHIEKRTGN